MHLIVHIGFHKTASTFLQSLLNENHAALAERGIWYAPCPQDCPEHHPIAWALMGGDTGPFQTMLRDAATNGCHTVLFSSEELECVPFNQQLADLIESTALASGVKTIEWDVVLRDPGEYFASLHAQLHWHTYADSLFMFTEVMNKGMLFMSDPMPKSGTRPYWFFCFDHHSYVGNFVRSTAAPVHVHDYADGQPFPGWRMLDRIGALDALVRPAGNPNARNPRRDELKIASGFCDRVMEAVNAPQWLPELAPAIEDCLRANLAGVPVFAEAVGKRYGPSYRAAIREFGPAEAREVAKAG